MEVRVAVTVWRGERVPVDVRVDVIVWTGERVPVDERVDVIVGFAVFVPTAVMDADFVVIGLRVPVTEPLDVREGELDFDAEDELDVVREPEEVFVDVGEAVDERVGIVKKFSKERF